MIALYINGNKAVIKSGTSIRLTRENPFFTSSGDYTLDVVLPLAGCPENQRVFGVLHYRAVSLKFLAGRKFPFRLLTELVQLEGTAVVTNVTQTEAKVQLLSGNSALNMNALGDKGELYIDELDLGRAYGDLWDSMHASSRRTVRQTPVNTAVMLAGLPKSERMSLLFGSRDVTDCVCFPIWSNTDAAFSNEMAVVHWGYVEDGTWKQAAQSYTFTALGNSYPDTGESRAVLSDDYLVGCAPQPYLSFILERVLEQVGFQLEKADNALASTAAGGFGNVFIANARKTVFFSEMLPHWTVKKFLDELRNAFGICVFVEGERAFAKTRASLFSRGFVEIKNAVDGRSTDIDTDGEQKETTSGNVAYAFTDAMPRVLDIGEDAYKKMLVVKVTEDSLNSEFASLTAEEKSASNILFFATDSGKRYGIFNTAAEGESPSYALREVDQMGALFRDGDFDIDTELHIVPCATENYPPTKRRTYERDDSDRREIYRAVATVPSDTHLDEEGGENGGFRIPYLVTADTNATTTGRAWSLQEAIVNGTDTDAEENPKQEVMEVASRCTRTYSASYTVNRANNRPIYSLYARYAIGAPHLVGQDGFTVDSERLRKDAVLDMNLASAAAGQAVRGGNLNIDTRVVRQISFTDNHSDPNAVYLIGGRKFLCQKIEVTLDENGVLPLKKGYFFEVE